MSASEKQADIHSSGGCLLARWRSHSGLAGVKFFPDMANELSFPAQEARFVRFVIVASSGSQPCLDELEVFDEPQPRPALPSGEKMLSPPKLPSAVEASMQEDAAWHTIDALRRRCRAAK